MEPDARAGGLEGWHSLRQEAGDEASEHVARTGSGQRRRGIFVDRGTAVGGGDHGVGTFEDDDGAAASGCGAGLVELGAGEIGENTFELALVRRDHNRARRVFLDQREQVPDDRLGVIVLVEGERRQRVGVEDGCGVEFEGDLDEQARGNTDACAGANQCGVAAMIGQDICEAAGTFEVCQHDRGEVGGVGGHCGGGACNGDEPSADAKRATGA